MFGDKNLFENEFFISRRGYGFSINLIDTFGYGMGLLTGYMLFVKWTRSRFVFLLSVLLMIFTIGINARTGIVCILIALLVKMVIVRKKTVMIRNIVLLVLLFITIRSSIPIVLEYGRKSSNVTVSWISSSFSDMYNLMSSDSAQRVDIEEVGFLDHFIGLPENTFELVFGTGHHMYDTYKSLGMRTDIGYINLFWEFGLLGGSILLLCIFWLILKPYFMTTKLSKLISIC